MKLEGPFVLGQVSRGQITYPGCEHIKWEAVVQKMEHERLFSFTWPTSQVPGKSRLSTGLLTGTEDARRIQAGEDRRWYVAGAHRIQLRYASR